MTHTRTIFRAAIGRILRRGIVVVDERADKRRAIVVACAFQTFCVAAPEE